MENCIKNQELIKAFKSSELEISKESPVVINKDMMMNVHGGGSSAGHVCTISGECNSSGKSCGGSVRAIFNSIAEMLW